MQKDKKCDIYERKPVRLNCAKPDCVTLSDCTIWEFKPSTYPKSDARSQASACKSDIDAYVEKTPRLLREVPKSCKSNGTISWKIKPDTYTACQPACMPMLRK